MNQYQILSTQPKGMNRFEKLIEELCSPDFLKKFADDELSPAVDDALVQSFLDEKLPEDQMEEALTLITTFRPWFSSFVRLANKKKK